MKVERGTGNGEGGERNAEGGARNAEWVTVKLGDVVDINPRRNSFGFTDDETVGFVPMSSVCEQKKAIVDQQVRPFGEVKKGYTPMQNGDVIIAKITPCFENGKVARVELPTSTAFGSTEFHVFRNRGTVDSDLVFHLLRSEQILRKGREQMKGAAGQKRVPADFFRAFEFRVPRSLPEQQRIARILDKADLLRQSRRAALAQLDALLQATFLDMFGDPVTNPKGWEVKALGEICDVRDGTHDSPQYAEEGHPLLTSKNFRDGKIDYGGANLISEEDFIQINKRSKVDVGDLVMPMIGTIGNPVLVENEPDFAIKNVALIKFPDFYPDNRYIRALLCSHYFDHITSKANRGGTQKFVALKDLRGMPIPASPLDLQRRFAAIVESVEAQKARMRAHLADLDLLFSSLQDRAFKGEL